MPHTFTNAGNQYDIIITYYILSNIIITHYKFLYNFLIASNSFQLEYIHVVDDVIMTYYRSADSWEFEILL